MCLAEPQERKHQSCSLPQDPGALSRRPLPRLLCTWMPVSSLQSSTQRGDRLDTTRTLVKRRLMTAGWSLRRGVKFRGPKSPSDRAAPPSVRPKLRPQPAAPPRGGAGSAARAAPAPGQLALPDIEAAHIGAGEAEAGEHRHPAAQPGARTSQRRRLGLPLGSRHRQQTQPVPAQRRHRARTAARNSDATGCLGPRLRGALVTSSGGAGPRPRPRHGNKPRAHGAGLLNNRLHVSTAAEPTRRRGAEARLRGWDSATRTGWRLPAATVRPARGSGARSEGASVAAGSPPSPAQPSPHYLRAVPGVRPASAGSHGGRGGLPTPQRSL